VETANLEKFRQIHVPGTYYSIGKQGDCASFDQICNVFEPAGIGQSLLEFDQDGDGEGFDEDVANCSGTDHGSTVFFQVLSSRPKSRKFTKTDFTLNMKWSDIAVSVHRLHKVNHADSSVDVSMQPTQLDYHTIHLLQGAQLARCMRWVASSLAFSFDSKVVSDLPESISPATLQELCCELARAGMHDQHGHTTKPLPILVNVRTAK
jgi:hypothetical protein